MTALLATEILLFFLLPLFAPLRAAAPAGRELPAPDPAAIHAALLSPQGTVGLPLAKDRSVPPTRKDVRDAGVVVAAKSAIAVDRATGAVLYEKAASSVHSIASLTKLVTALVVLDAVPDWDARVKVLADDLRGGGVEYFIPGETVTVRDLFSASLVGSSNTATAALARSTGLSADVFRDRMNAKARRLGMFTAHLVEPTGLDAGNRASARDAVLLARAAFASPDIAGAVTAERYVFRPGNPKGTRVRTVRSTDLLLGSALNAPPYRIVGGKTGTLGAETGYHVALDVGAADDRELLVVVLGSDTNAGRFADAKAIALWAFDAYHWQDRRAVADAR